MSSQEFISDMEKFFAVSAISNFGAKICQFSIVDGFSNRPFWRPHKCPCAQSAEMLASAFQLYVFILTSWSRSLIRNASAVGFTIEANLRLISDVS